MRYMKKIYSAALVMAFYSFSFSSTAQTTPAIKPHINHIAHYVVNLARSTDFYMHIIGLDSIPEPFHDGKHTWLSVGCNAHLHLIKGATEAATINKNAHLCFSVASVPDFVLILKDHHIEFENWAGEKNAVTNRVDGVKQIYFKDPDGYWIEINDAKD
ncbi:MAG: VOC family protein [Bacteroidetes bacterium]|nr:VOC family protein [Bacteroidota bacterium]